MLVLAIERATGLKARGVLKEELASTLERHGVEAKLAEQATQLLARCDELRFAGEALDLPSFGAEVREISQKLGQRKAWLLVMRSPFRPPMRSAQSGFFSHSALASER